MLITVFFAAIIFNAGTGSSEETHYELTCESKNFYARCWDGAKIQIETVFWGRKEKDPYCGGVSEKICLGQPSATQDFLMKSCDKQLQCLVNATIANLGNPCPEPSNSKNYLQVAYKCSGTPRKKKAKKEKRKKACVPLPEDVEVITENSKTLSINCALDQSIKIKLATYGKVVKRCSKRDAIENTGSRQKAMMAVYKRCEGRMRCSVPIKPRLFGDRHSTKKHLQVAYKCVDRPLTLVEVTKDEENRMRCPGRTKVFINLAHNNCIDYVEEECQRKKECYISDCRVKYSCQTPKKFDKDGKPDGGSGSDENSTGESSSKASDEESDDSTEYSSSNKRKKEKKHKPTESESSS